MSTPAAVSPDATFALKFPSELAIPLAAVGVSDIPTISMMIPPINGGIAFLLTGFLFYLFVTLFLLSAAFFTKKFPQKQQLQA